MHKVQKTYTAELKREAVHLAQTSGKPIARVARELGISDPSMYPGGTRALLAGVELFPDGERATHAPSFRHRCRNVIL